MKEAERIAEFVARVAAQCMDVVKHVIDTTRPFRKALLRKETEIESRLENFKDTVQHKIFPEFWLSLSIRSQKRGFLSMLKTEPSLLDKIDFVPQAIIGADIFELAKRLHVDLKKGHDDLDEYYGNAFKLPDVPPFALMRYRGHPKDKTTLYLPGAYRDIKEITLYIDKITNALSVQDRLEWQRADDPTL